jgi:phosphoribosyl-ATP pyrophosphohydrolase
MVARLAKNPAAARRPLVPAALLEPALDERNAAVSRTVAMPAADMARCAEPQSIVEPAGNELDRLYASLEAVTPENHPRTARLLRSSNRKVAQKVIEEAGEVALAAVKHNNRGIVRESADLLYHLAVLWRRAGIDSADIWAEMRRRAESLGIAEKLPKADRG